MKVIRRAIGNRLNRLNTTLDELQKNRSILANTVNHRTIEREA